MDSFYLLKAVHIVSSTLLFGTGLGTAFHMLATHLRGDVRAIAITAKNVVLADNLFTTPCALIQPASGIGLILMAGHDPWSSWLVAAYGLYIFAGACWMPVVGLQVRMARLAATAVAEGTPLPPAYHQAMRAWFWLGWPAFAAFLAIFPLMVGKPDLW